MKIDHLAIWVDDLECMRIFYISYFNMESGEKYINEKKGFSSYFLRFGQQTTRLELMHKTDIPYSAQKRGHVKGIAHFSISVGGKDAVDRLTERLRADHYSIVGEPRTTGDGYYESSVLDPEGNLIEISA